MNQDQERELRERALERASFCHHMLEASKQGPMGFHMPGHRGGSVYPAALREQFLSLDLTELPTTDDLNDPGELLRETEGRWARELGAEALVFLTAGSSCGIKGALYGMADFGGQVIALTPVHQAYFQAASLLNLTTLYLPQDPDLARQFLTKAPPSFSPSCLYITSPDYFGCVLDLPFWLGLVREFYPDLPLLVDEAHGAHFPWLQGAPRALDLGASVAVQSLHKTLPAPTPSAMVLSRDPALAPRIREGVRLFGTSSPPLALVAAMDYALSYMSLGGRAALEAQARRLGWLVAELEEAGFAPGRGALCPSPRAPLFRDPTRLALDVSRLGSGFAAEEALLEAGVAVEMADPAHLLLLTYVGQPEAAYRNVKARLEAWAQGPRDARGLFDPEGYGIYRELLGRAYYPERGGYAPEAQRAQQGAPREKRHAMIPYPPGLGMYAPGEEPDWAKVGRLEGLGIRFT